MSQKLYPLVLLFGCIIILHVFVTSAQYLPTEVNTGNVPDTSFGIPNQYNAISFSSNFQPAILSSFGTSSSQQLIPTDFSSSANGIPPTSSSSLLPPGVVPSSFTQAMLAIPSLQRFLYLQIPRFQGADLHFRATYDCLKSLGHPTPGVIANVVSQNFAELDFFTIPLYVLIEGGTVEKFLILEGIEIVPSLVQFYANTLETALESSIVNNIEDLISVFLKVFKIFFQSLGFNYVEKLYVLALIFNAEIAAVVDALNP